MDVLLLCSSLAVSVFLGIVITSFTDINGNDAVGHSARGDTTKNSYALPSNNPKDKTGLFFKTVSPLGIDISWSEGSGEMTLLTVALILGIALTTLVASCIGLAGVSRRR
jgi:hypothetical protein